ncbi:hypothetical protein BCV69DRAFT_246728 [Microstroma glucosiphilum]|uniref:Major facilitator superfamily (MFS) profile domain-containing protein n=1 Tax=Pseudomicrostroma glucosiphilum TaxID=1684307 RepID=A0A316UBP1_9BASI|nr:hypothetical protein BCV69DRAFT_246728 [Pseudomicrostroma glucosiphilum]PWN22582.1 hypothetical protein BCV69DRAFT_246728 [Pseudomicrostroma glucosiphilum]
MVQGTAAGKVVNPLAHLSKQQLLEQADSFCNEKGLEEHRNLIQRGALVAQNPASYRLLEELSEEEKDAITYELTHKWSHPWPLYFTIVTCSIGAAVQGWDQTGSNGANLSFPAEFGIGGEEERDGWIVGVVNAAPYLASAFVGCWLSDPLNNLFGRRGCIFLTALCLIATPIASGVSRDWQGLLVSRLVMGLGMGAKGATVPIFAAENSPAAIRGALVMSWQLWTAFGIFLGFAANVIVAGAGAITWRLQLASAFIPALPLAAMIYFCPESPRWLIKKNRYPQAFRSLCRLRHNKIQAARDLYYIHAMIVEEAKIIKGETFIKRAIELFTIPRVRRATVASGVVMLGQQMCGINIIAFYSSTIFVESGFTERQAIYSSLGFGAINFAFAFPAVGTIDTFGRRALLLSTFPNMCWCLIVAGCGTLLPTGSTAQLGIVATFVYLFAAFYSTGEGPVPFAYSAECFPLAHREIGMAWAVATCLFWAAVLSITLPPMLLAFTSLGVFMFYAGLNALAFCLIYLFLPETKQATLEELDAVFSISHARFIRYNLTQVTPSWFRRNVLWQRKYPRPPPLVEMDEHVGGAAADWAKKGAA